MSNTRKIKKLTLVKTDAKPHEIARALGQRNSFNAFGPLTGDDENSNVTSQKDIDYSQVADTAISIGSKLSNSKRVTGKQFYAYRDQVYKMLKDAGKNFGALPGNPFSIFGHAVIKDSPLKNYKNELAAFKEMVKKHYPEIYAQIENESTQIIQRQNANAQVNDGSIEEILQGVTADYIEQLKRKREGGFVLSNAEQKILAAYDYLNDKVRDGARNQISKDVGAWLMDNWVIILLGLLVVGFVVYKRK